MQSLSGLGRTSWMHLACCGPLSAGSVSRFMKTSKLAQHFLSCCAAETPGCSFSQGCCSSANCLCAWSKTDPAVPLLADCRYQPPNIQEGGWVASWGNFAWCLSFCSTQQLSPFCVCSRWCRGWIQCPCTVPCLRQAPDCPGVPE